MVAEYRITYQRRGGKKQYKIIQNRGTAERFVNKLRQDTRPDLAPLETLYFETRWCTDWTATLL
jgi:hypothetical protein